MTTTLTATAASATGLATASDSLLSGGCGGVCGVSVGGVAAALGVWAFLLLLLLQDILYGSDSAKDPTNEEST